MSHRGDALLPTAARSRSKVPLPGWHDDRVRRGGGSGRPVHKLVARWILRQSSSRRAKFRVNSDRHRTVAQATGVDGPSVRAYVRRTRVVDVPLTHSRVAAHDETGRDHVRKQTSKRSICRPPLGCPPTTERNLSVILASPGRSLGRTRRNILSGQYLTAARAGPVADWKPCDRSQRIDGNPAHHLCACLGSTRSGCAG